MSIKFKVEVSFPKVDSFKFQIPCPKCKVKNTVSLEQIKRGETIRCSGCGIEIKLHDKGNTIQNATDNIQKSLDDLEGKLKRLG